MVLLPMISIYSIILKFKQDRHILYCKSVSTKLVYILRYTNFYISYQSLNDDSCERLMPLHAFWSPVSTQSWHAAPHAHEHPFVHELLKISTQLHAYETHQLTHFYRMSTCNESTLVVSMYSFQMFQYISYIIIVRGLYSSNLVF